MRLIWKRLPGTGCNEIAWPTHTNSYAIYYCEGVCSLYFLDFLLAHHTTVDRAKEHAQTHFDKYCSEISKKPPSPRYRVLGTLIVDDSVKESDPPGLFRNGDFNSRIVCNVRGYHGETGQPLVEIFCKLLNQEYGELRRLKEV